MLQHFKNWHVCVLGKQTWTTIKYEQQASQKVKLQYSQNRIVLLSKSNSEVTELTVCVNFEEQYLWSVEECKVKLVIQSALQLLNLNLRNR